MAVDNFLTLLVTAGALLTAALASVGWSVVFVLERRVTGWWAVDLSLAVFCGWFALIYTLVLFGEISGPAAGIYLRPATNGLMFSLACMTVRFIDPHGRKVTQLRQIIGGSLFSWKRRQ